MARKARFSPEGVPQHVIQRGNNRQICFGSEEDFKAYLHWLKQYSKKYGVSVHAWVLMTNHVYLLCTPWSVDGLSKMMQSVGRSYVHYFNDTYQRTGTLWEGRFKSCLTLVGTGSNFREAMSYVAKEGNLGEYKEMFQALAAYYDSSPRDFSSELMLKHSANSVQVAVSRDLLLKGVKAEYFLVRGVADQATDLFLKKLPY